MIKLVLAVIGITMITSCASVQSVSLTPIPKQRSKVIKAEVSKFVFLAFNFNNDFIDEIVDQLKEKCPDGVISGILTKDESVSYILAHTRKISASAFCNDAKATHASLGTPK